MLNLLLNIILNFLLIYFFGIIGAAIATLIANIISIIISIRFANMFAFFLYETKKIFIICSFVVISFVMAVLSNFISSNINYELLFNFILFFLIAGSYIFYGFYSKILTSSSLKLIFRIHDMK
jgi:O-antigen/teichoic acid export membrane protein